MNTEADPSRRVRGRDPLLTAARLVLGIVMVIFVVGGLAIACAIPVVFFLRDKVLDHFVAQGTPLETVAPVLMIQVLAVAAAIIGYAFFRNIFRIIATVEEGDPFVPANARRLNTMGWIAVGGHLLIIPFNIVGRRLETVTNTVGDDFGLSLAGILLILILFILARVFGEGAQMREELEGTV